MASKMEGVLVALCFILVLEAVAAICALILLFLFMGTKLWFREFRDRLGVIELT
jgi:hypothetical protein